MNRLAFLLLLLVPQITQAFNGRLGGWCEQGGQTIQVNGVSSTQRVQRSYPACQVTVYIAGSLTLATIYSDTVNTPLANPFTASSVGYWFFYAADNFYDVRISGGGLAAPFTFGGLNINTSSGGGGGGAPTNALYWLGAANGSLGSAFNLGALATGIVKNTAGTPSIAIGTDLPNHGQRHLPLGDDPVTSYAAGPNLIPASDITGRIAAGWLPDTAVLPGLYGSASSIGQFTVDQQGRITSAANVTIAGVPPSGAAGGVLTGSYPNPALAAIVAPGTFGSGTLIPVVSINAAGQVTGIATSGISIAGIAAGGDVTGTYPNPTLTATGVVAGIYGNMIGNSITVPRFTIDSKGRVTLAQTFTGSFIQTTDALTGDVSGTFSATSVNKINGQSLAALATGLLKNATGTGVPSIAGSTDVIGLWTGTCNAGSYLNGAGSCSTPSGAGDVTHTSGALSSGQLIIGNGGGDIKVGNLSGAITTVGGTVTSFTDGNTGTGAIVHQVVPTLASPILANPNIINAIFDSVGQGVFEMGPNVGGPAMQAGHIKVTLPGPIGSPPYNLTLGVIADNGATPVNLNLVSGGGRVMVDVSELRLTGVAPSVGQALTAANTSGDLVWTSLSGTGTVTSVGTATPITGGPFTTTGTISCPSCVTSASSLTNHLIVVGAGSQGSKVITAGTAGQFLQSQGSGADPTWASTAGTVSSVGTASPLTGGPITGTGTISCATCVTSAAALTSNSLMIGQGSQASATMSAGIIGQVLGNSGGAPVWVTPLSPLGVGGGVMVCSKCVTAPSALTNGQLVVGSGSEATHILSAGTAGSVLTSAGAGTDPAWVTRDSAASSFTYPFHDGFGATEVRDNGGQVYNVKAFGAVGDCVANDTSALQTTINNAQNSARGGTVYFPPGCYLINATLTVGNGTTILGSPNTTTESTQKPVTLQGINTGVDASRRGASIIKWGGANSAVWMLEYRGPLVGGELNDLIFDAGVGTPLVKGVRLRGAAHMFSRNLGIIQTALGMEITTEGNALYGACDNTFIGLKITSPSVAVSGSGGGSGINLSGNDQAGGTVDSCSNTFYASDIVHDANDLSTYGVRLHLTDNNRFFGANIYGFPNTVYSTGTASITSGNPGITGFGTTWTSAMNGFPLIIFGSPAGCGSGGPCRTYTFTFGSATSGTLSPTPDVTVGGGGGTSYAIRGGGAGVLFVRATSNGIFPTENTFYSTSMHQGPKGTAGTGTPNAFYDWHLGDCFTNCLLSQQLVDPSPIYTSSDRTQYGGGTTSLLGATTNYRYLEGKDFVGNTIFSLSRGAISTNGLSIASFDDVDFSANVVRGKYKNYSGTSQPYACAANFEGSIWLDTTSNPNVLKACGRNSGGTYVWSNVFTF